MPGQSTGAPQTSHNHKPYTSSARMDTYRETRTIYRESTVKQDMYNNHHGDQLNVHPKYAENKYGRSKGHVRNGTSQNSETIGFIPGSADSTSSSRATCDSCASVGWNSCKSIMCCILTCGFYGSRDPCVPANESSTDHPPKSGGEPPPGMVMMTNPTCGVPLEPNKPTKPNKLPPSESFRYPDVRFRGEIINYPVNAPKRTRAPVKGETHRPISNTSLLSNDYYDLDDPCDSTDVDSLITKKLLELYALHQIEELAKCTSDSSFSRKTNEISELIYNIAQNYNLEEQEAECKLVHGVIRISTRKGKKKASHHSTGHRPNGRSDGTLPDSGNETMTCSSEYPEVKVSEQTPSDELARKMRHYSGRAYTSNSATAYSPYLHNTGTHSSAAPLLI